MSDVHGSALGCRYLTEVKVVLDGLQPWSVKQKVLLQHKEPCVWGGTTHCHVSTMRKKCHLNETVFLSECPSHHTMRHFINRKLSQWPPSGQLCWIHSCLSITKDIHRPSIGKNIYKYLQKVIERSSTNRCKSRKVTHIISCDWMTWK